MAFLEYSPTQTLYQYCSIDGFLGILKSKTLWLSDLSAANDPREIQFGLDKFMEALKGAQNVERTGERDPHLAELADDIMKHRVNAQLFCACFSKVADELPMWREYGDNSTGLAIGFRPSAISAMAGRVQCRISRERFVGGIPESRSSHREGIGEIQRALALQNTRGN